MTSQMYNELNNATSKPAIWSEYTADVLWTDSHIATQMLTFHLNPDLSLASRTAKFIDQSVDWLVSEFQLSQDSKVIDFGCGPGLYTHRLAQKGVGTVVGLDFSANSLSYAKEKAKQENHSIEYKLGNYLEYQDTRKFDLITLIMCDLCALNPTQRSEIYKKFKSLLAKNGAIALDVYTDTRFEAQQQTLSLEKNAMNGFWSVQDYWCIQSSFTYQDEKVTLDKYVLYQQDRVWTVYNWLAHFSVEKLSQELSEHGLRIERTYQDLRGTPLVGGDEMALVIVHQ